MKRFVFAFPFFLAVAAPLRAKPAWQAIIIPILPASASLGPVWAGLSGDLYVWAETRGGPLKDIPTAHLLHWDGKRWDVALQLPGHEPAAVFGVNEMNVFAAANKCAEGRSAGCGADRGPRIFRSTDDGVTWAPQALPPEAEGRAVNRLDGAFENVQAVMGGSSLIRFDGVGWNQVFQSSGSAAGRSLSVSFQGTNEGYLVSCNGWGRWIDGAWKFMPMEFGFCEAKGLWGIRDRQGGLLLYAADSHRFSNGVRVWKFNPPLEDFEMVFGDESEDDWGSANGIWGSAEDDVYVIGQIGAGARMGAGRVYHFDGKSWARETSMGLIPAPLGIHGTSRNDVWIALTDGRLLHYSTATSVTRKMSGASSPPD